MVCFSFQLPYQHYFPFILLNSLIILHPFSWLDLDHVPELFCSVLTPGFHLSDNWKCFDFASSCLAIRKEKKLFLLSQRFLPEKKRFLPWLLPCGLSHEHPRSCEVFAGGGMSLVLAIWLTIYRISRLKLLFSVGYSVPSCYWRCWNCLSCWFPYYIQGVFLVHLEKDFCGTI